MLVTRKEQSRPVRRQLAIQDFQGESPRVVSLQTTFQREAAQDFVRDPAKKEAFGGELGS